MSSPLSHFLKARHGGERNMSVLVNAEHGTALALPILPVVLYNADAVDPEIRDAQLSHHVNGIPKVTGRAPHGIPRWRTFSVSAAVTHSGH